MLKHVDFEVAGWGELAQMPPAWHALAQTTLARNPAGYWRLSETGGTIAADAAGHNDGQYAGSYALNQPGLVYRDANRAVALDQSNDGRIALPFIAYASEVSVVARIQVDAIASPSGSAVIVAWGQAVFQGHTAEFRLKDVAGTGVLQMGIKDGNGFDAVTGTIDLLDGQPHSVAMTRDGTDIRLYVDGQLDGQANLNKSPFLDTTNIGVLERSGFSNPFDGRIDEVAIFHAALGADALADWHAKAAGVGRLSV